MNKKLKEYLFITLGALLVAVGVYFFKFPNHYSFGGVTGLAIIISQLTGEMQTLFKDAFASINRHFGEIFRQLFGGGKASLRLDDPEDILECGIEILVQPPGKIIKNLASLSGGEQALVAVAIYFAILKVRPSIWSSSAVFTTFREPVCAWLRKPTPASVSTRTMAPFSVMEKG